jgi:hypothetical protein
VAGSARFVQLQKRTTELRKHFIPPLDLTGVYSDRQYDRVRGYRLLVHAEIESFLEDRVTELAVQSFSKWEIDRRPRTCLTALVAYYDTQFPSAPSSVLKPAQNPKLDLLEARIEKAKNVFVLKAKTQNNGIREENVLALVLPVGVQAADLNQTWLATIDSFGRERGLTAHTAGRTQQPPDPASEVQTVNQLLRGLKDIDEVFTKLSRE